MADTPFEIERSPILEGVPHGFFGSARGVHQFGYGGPGDADEIRALRAKAAGALVSSAPLIAPHQVHSPDVVTVEETWPDAPEGRCPADALVTNRKGIVLGIVTADCGPVLFADQSAGVVGAAHAGWRGAHGGVLENTIAAMEKLGASRKNMTAAIGPTIAQPSYEVDSGFRAQFDDGCDPFFAPAAPREGKQRWHFDLPGYVAQRLKNAGLRDICDLARDTYTESERYYSFRRATHRQEPNYGRQLSAIALG